MSSSTHSPEVKNRRIIAALVEAGVHLPEGRSGSITLHIKGGVIRSHETRTYGTL